MKQRVTIKDVARQAGVSATTVSHVLSGQGRFSDRTRDKVQAAARDLDYQPHPAARSLRTARFDAIGLLLPHRATSLEFYSDLAMGAARAAFAAGQSITLLPPDASVEAIVAMSIDSVVVADPLVDDPSIADLGERIPTVLCERAEGALAAVDLGHERMMGELLNHFVEQGAERICVLRPPTSVWWGRRLDDGVRAWTGRSPDREVIVQEMPFVATAEEVARCLDRALAQRPDALFVAQEGVVPLILAAAEKHGLRVPEDILLAVGVDGRDARHSPVPVTAVDLAARECGELAVGLSQAAAGQVARANPLLRIRLSSTRVERSMPSR